MDDQRLFRISPDAIAVTARFEHPDGWSLVVTSSAAGRFGRETRTERYDRLTSDEMLDAMTGAVQAHL